MLHDGMPCDLIQGQGHGSLKVAKMADFRVYLLRQFACIQKTNGDLCYSKTFNSSFNWADF